MQHRPASRFITDLDAAKATQTPAAQTPPPRRAQPGGPENLRLHTVQDKSSPQQRVADARQAGFDEGRATAKTQFEAVVKAQRTKFEKQIEVERVTWASREADKLTEQLAAGLEQLQSQIADQVAELLKPFIESAMHRRAMSELERAIGTILAKDEGVTLEVFGPNDLLQLLREKLSGKNMAVLFHPGEGPEVRIVVGQTVLETQLGAWAARVEEALR
jgi:hypothetical protein